MSAQTLRQIDEHLLNPSQLTDKRKSELNSLFSMIKSDFNPIFPYRLEFRHGGLLTANALALPSGTVVITDELVGLVKDDKEIAAVLAHEIAHVERRHALRSILQDAGIFLLISLLVGDVASITSIATSLPTLIVESGYSHQFEIEADESSGRLLIRNGWSTKPLRDILQRLAEHYGDFSGPTWLSSHPSLPERIAYLQALEKTTAIPLPPPNSVK